MEVQISADPGAGLGHAGIGPQVDFLVFGGPPEAFDEDVIAPDSLAIHADLDIARGQHLDKVCRIELAAPDALLSVKRQFAYGRSLGSACK